MSLAVLLQGDGFQNATWMPRERPLAQRHDPDDWMGRGYKGILTRWYTKRLLSLFERSTEVTA